MCGISGFISKKRITVEQLIAMNDTMLHRGPDDSGAEIFAAADGYSVGLAQRRLSIIDHLPAGASADACGGRQGKYCIQWRDIQF